MGHTCCRVFVARDLEGVGGAGSRSWGWAGVGLPPAGGSTIQKTIAEPVHATRVVDECREPDKLLILSVCPGGRCGGSLRAVAAGDGGKADPRVEEWRGYARPASPARPIAGVADRTLRFCPRAVGSKPRTAVLTLRCHDMNIYRRQGRHARLLLLAFLPLSEQNNKGKLTRTVVDCPRMRRSGDLFGSVVIGADGSPGLA